MGKVVNLVNYEVKSLAEELIMRHFDTFENMIDDAVELMTDMSTEVEVIYKNEKSIDFHYERVESKWNRRVTYVVHAEIVPYILQSKVFNEGDFTSKANADELNGDFILLYSKGVPIGYALYDSGINANEPEYIDTIYIDKYAKGLGTDDEVRHGVEMLLDKTMQRFSKESDVYKSYCPPVAIVKAQEYLFENIINRYGWRASSDDKQYNRTIKVYNK